MPKLGSASSEEQAGVYVPMIYEVDLDRSPSPKFLRHLNEMVTPALAHGWPVIAQPRLFSGLTSAPEVVWAEERGSSARSEQEVASLDCRTIPDDIEQAILDQCGGIDEAWIQLGQRSFPALEACVSAHLADIVSYYGSVRAVVMWRPIPSVRQAADSLGIPVIDIELASIRQTLYRDTLAYFQFGPHFDTAEFDQRLSRFLSDRPDVPVLTRKEILALFLRDQDLYRLVSMDWYEEYEIGAALSSASNIEVREIGAPTNEQVIDQVGTFAGLDTVLVRPHPPEKPQVDDRVHLDDSIDAADFILRCRRIVATASNMGYEAMLYGKTAYVWASMPFAGVSVTARERLDEAVVDLATLNWITFAFFAPYDLVFDRDYLDWRLTKPSEEELYRRHLDHYLARWGVSPEVLQLSGTERLAAFLAVRGAAVPLFEGIRQQVFEDVAGVRTERDSLRKQRDALLAEVGQVYAANAVLSGSVNEAQAKIDDLLGSTSWRLTAPLRRITDRVKAMTRASVPHRKSAV